MQEQKTNNTQLYRISSNVPEPYMWKQELNEI